MGEDAAIRQRYEVPDAVRTRVDGTEILAWLPGYEVAVRRVAARPEALPEADVRGRGTLYRIEGQDGALLVRPYRKGGLLRAVRAGRFLGPLRPLQELVLHRRLEALGIPVAQAVGCAIDRSPVGWRGFLVVKEVERAVDLEAWLHGIPTPTPPPGMRAPRRAAVLRRAGRAVRRLHDAGVKHADLHPKNLLLTPGGRVLVLDLDKAVAADLPLQQEDRLENLARLGRAVEKHRLKGMHTGRREALRFLEGYAGSREAATEWLARVRTRLLRGGLPLRVVWWRLLGQARPWQGAQAAGGGGAS